MAPELDRKEWSRWLKGRPEKVRQTAERYPPHQCYRDHRAGHYVLMSYFESGNVRVLHGNDSFAPGFEVFEFDPSDLVPCQSFDWQEATIENAKRAMDKVDMIAFGRKAAEA